jgi:hypothetical protein
MEFAGMVGAALRTSTATAAWGKALRGCFRGAISSRVMLGGEENASNVEDEYARVVWREKFHTLL